MPASGTYSMDAVRVLDTHRTPIQKQPEALLCLEVPVATDPGSGQAVEAVVAGPPTVRESRKRGPEGVDANA
nr:hypothetical protein [Tanacetum cinerariifolium]